MSLSSSHSSVASFQLIIHSKCLQSRHDIINHFKTQQSFIKSWEDTMPKLHYYILYLISIIIYYILLYPEKILDPASGFCGLLLSLWRAYWNISILSHFHIYFHAHKPKDKFTSWSSYLKNESLIQHELGNSSRYLSWKRKTT